ASKDFQSVGVSLNLTAELDQGLLSDPPRLQSEIDRLALSFQAFVSNSGRVRRPARGCFEWPRTDPK
ncbi:MAG: hypothetical protein ACKOJI_10120, partial [Phycisphaerales bacterium]